MSTAIDILAVCALASVTLYMLAILAFATAAFVMSLRERRQRQQSRLRMEESRRKTDELLAKIARDSGLTS